MSPQWKNRYAAAIGCFLAVIVGWDVANNSYGFAVLLMAIAVGVSSIAFLRLSLDVLVLCGLVFGYIVGNRGFAQLTLVPGMPLFPAEAGLALGATVLLVRSALSRRLPWRADLLNAAILLWMALAAARIIPDLRSYGVMALRDFAVVYYAGFFFIAQAHASSPRAKSLVQGSLFIATLLAVPCFELFRRFPNFFLEHLTVRGVPLIFLKGDLVATFMAAGAVLAYARYEGTRRHFWLVASLASVVAVLSSDNRASVVALLGATAWFMVARCWRWLGMLGGGVVAAVLILLTVAVFSPGRSDSPLQDVVDRVASVVDFSGRHRYRTENEYKADNNRFRLVWWRTVIDETFEEAPVLGLGFGYDLAEDFTREYGADEEMTARSPHSILVTVLGRMGVAGLAAFLALVAAVGVKTWRVLRAEPLYPDAAQWILVCVILISACFGVVLEGPMGAVVFWTALGLANGSRTDDPAPEGQKTAAPEVHPQIEEPQKSGEGAKN